MEKLKLHTRNLVAENVERVGALFPDCVTEARDENGKLTRAIDFDRLRQQLSDSLVEGPRERYQLDWPGKREAMLAASAPIAKTLRPCREESVDFDRTKNIFVEGDNLDALKLLQEAYLGKVKMIYIDPPYNTGKEFIYNDDFAENPADYLSRSNQTSESGDRLTINPESNGRFHSDWLTMMYPRLKLARNLLSEDGVIFISIDDHEFSNMKTMCEEVFGGDNFVATIVWQKRYSRENRGSIGDAHEYVLTYARSLPEFANSSGRIPLTEEQAKVYRNPDDNGGRWRGIPMTAQGFRPNQMYPITAPGGAVHTPPEGRCWSMIESEYKKLLDAGRIYFGKDNNSQPQVIRYLSEVEGLTPWTWLPHEEGGHTDEAKKEIYTLLGKGFGFDTPKPTRLITRLLQIASKAKDYLVMDFFAGSGTTADAVVALNAHDGGKRQFILVQIPEACADQTEGG
ncbi:MAG TPA: site-specific DNA-methyltransferase, partial [Tepidisphaeraceae bacterium]|nr:site-specific DNA-methyltransferase [Tepidisphaeraceae bacterium]